MDELRKLASLVKHLERQKNAVYTFTNPGIKKQAEYLEDFSHWLTEDLRDSLEDELGTLPESIDDVIKKGETKIGDRLHLLKVADKYR